MAVRNAYNWVAYADFRPVEHQHAFAGLALQRMESSLHQAVRRWAHAGARGRAFVLLDDGEGWLEGANGSRGAVAGPSLHWLVDADGVRFRAEAGSTGYIGSAGEAFLSQLGAGYTDAPLLSFVVDRDHHLPLTQSGNIELLVILDTLYSELQVPRVGSPIVLAAQFRILLVNILRLSGLDVSFEGSGAEARFLQRFRELVEVNFRERWPVGRYAQRIGISHDRLHSLCTRKLGRTPKALIAERVAREAALALERSTLSLQQLSYALGFRDPAHFSHFFKRVAGISPGAYRRRATGGATESLASASASFADWP